MSKILSLFQQGLKMVTNVSNMNHLAAPIELVAVTNTGSCTFQWKVTEEQMNDFGTLHNGFTAFMVDFSTSAALAIMEQQNSGVSVDMSISHLHAAKLGETVIMDTKCKKFGSTLAFMEATLRNSEGKILATGKHTKYVG